MPRLPKNILLVEDEPTLQRILGSVLTDVGHRVESVGTAEQALERLADTGAPDVDLVLSDKNLPAMSGLELLEQLRALERTRNRAVGFVLVTGYPSRDSALSVLAHDGDGYLVKPFRSLSNAVEQVQGVLDANLAERHAGGPDARRLARLMAGAGAGTGALPGDEPLAAKSAAVLVHDDGVTKKIKLVLEKHGVMVADTKALPPSPAAVAVIGSRVEDLAAFAKARKGAALVLVDDGASFSDLVTLIGAGGGAVADPGLLPRGSGDTEPPGGRR